MAVMISAAMNSVRLARRAKAYPVAMKVMDGIKTWITLNHQYLSLSPLIPYQK